MMVWRAIVLVGMLLAVGCGNDGSGGLPWGFGEREADRDEYDECYNGGCDYEDDYWEDECLNGGCDYYDECLNGGCDYDYPEALPTDAVELGELVACDPSPACDRECVIDMATGDTDCELDASSGRVVLDMSEHAALTVRATLTWPEGIAFHLGDSPSNDGFGGDGAEFSNDAEVHLVGNGLYVFGSDRSVGDPGRVRGIPDVIPAEGGVLELTLADGMLSVRADAPLGPMCHVETSDDLLRLDAADSEGRPDRLWFLGLNQAYSGVRLGSGLDRVELCFH